MTRLADGAGDGRHALSRRTLLGSLAAAGAGAVAGCGSLNAEEDAPTTAVDDERARELAVRFAPTLYFDEHERWFPTDPRPYVVEEDGDAVVDGFEAFDGYAAAFEDAAQPPAPTAFYNVVRYEESPLAVVQFWFYSAFDQFSVNFHWHDWEVLHVFVDLDTGDPQLYVASSHSRKVPNNEFLDPDPEMVPRILSELGSHSSALSVNDASERFQRLPGNGRLADVTNNAVEGLAALAEVPLAYGLPRDEGSRLPFVLPELDGAPIHEHDRLPSVDRSHLIDEALTVRSFDAVSSPPDDLPERATGLVFDHEERDDVDVAYELVPSAELEDISAFTGPQLSFEFAVPQAVEDAAAGHLTTTGVPWGQPRYDRPALDVTEPSHRAALAERYDAIGDPGPVNSVLAGVTRAVTEDDAPEDEGLTTEATTTEAVALLESDPEAVPTFRGVAMVRDVPAGDHRLTVNGAGSAPHSETVTVEEPDDDGSTGGDGGGDDGTTETDGSDAVDAPGPVTAAGVDGEIPLVARSDAVKLEVDPAESDRALTDLAVEDDFAGRLYDAPLEADDAVYLHRGGAYTAEVRDEDGEVGAYRRNPDAGDEGVAVREPSTGKEPLARYLADVAAETRASVAAAAGDGDDDDDDDRGTETGGSSNAVQGLERALEAVAEAATAAADRAASGDRNGTDERLAAVETRLERVSERLADARSDVPDPVARAVDRRLEASDRRTEQAQAAEKL